jgi:LPXTG-motif cell wall-anchored protein
LPQTGMGNEWLLLLAAALLVALIYVVRRMRTSRT